MRAYDAPVPSPQGPLARRLRALRASVIYRADQVLGWPPLGQVLALFVVTLLVVATFAGLEHFLRPDGAPFGETFFWALTHFLDGGTVASDDASHRVLGTVVTVTGITTLALLTAALTAKMGERIRDMRSGLSPVVERRHILCLGFGPDVPLVARELARTHQRLTLVVLARDDKDRIEASLRVARAVAGHRLKIVVRTGDPRVEMALLQVAAPEARAAIVVPPSELDDEGSVRWTLATLLALRRVVGEVWKGHVVVETRHEEASELLGLATERDVAGPGALRADIVAADAVLGGMLAQSVRDDGVYFVLRHLLAFDGAEIYSEPVPAALLGRTFAYAHARIDDAIAIGLSDAGATPVLCPADDRVLGPNDRVLVVARGRGALRLDGQLPETEPAERRAASDPIAVTVVGVNGTLPHVVRELDGLLPAGSTVHVVAGEAHARATALLERVQRQRRSVAIEVDGRSAAALTRDQSPRMCGADAVVILGEESRDDENGDASALATLLRLRRATKRTGDRRVRVVTEVRDPRSAAHIAPSARDCIVSSDVVAMLVAQSVVDPVTAPAYREILGPDGASVALRSRHELFGERALTFADAMAALRRTGEIAIGIYPDPRVVPGDPEAMRRALEEGAPATSEDAWLNPPRRTAIPTRAGTSIVVLTRRR